ncbi:MAG: sugar ABC transporter substrate-binding protein [Treponema sp.]|nr:sugar ABC transporter substrate-binding protein [Treponema sp.]
MKKILWAALFAALVLSGCQKKSDKASAAAGGTKVVNLWTWDETIRADYETLIKEFEQANPGIKVNLLITPWADYWTKLQTALPTGTGPDVFWLNHPNAVSYLPTGLVKDLEPWAGDIQFENFDRNFYDPFTYQGKRYAVPIMWDDIVLFYNKAAFDKAGVAYPTADWTWDDYLAAARKLTVRSGNQVTQYGTIANASFQSGVGPFIYQNGGVIFNADRTKVTLNTPEIQEAVQFNMDLIYLHKVAPTIEEVAEATADALFQSGVVAMMPGLSIRIGFFGDVLGQDLNVAPLPRKKAQGTVFHNVAYAVSDKTANPEEVRKFTAFLASRRHAEVIANTFAPCYNGMTELYFKNYSWVDTGVVSDSINYGHPLPIASRNAGAVWTEMEDGMSRIFSSGSLGSQLADLENAINASIAK